MDDHKQKYVEITKDCLWNELQNHFVESTEKKLVCLQIDCKHLQCSAAPETRLGLARELLLKAR